MNKSEPVAIAQIIRERVLIDSALQTAFREAVLRHRQAGVPMVFWQDGRVVWIDPQDIPLPDDPPRTASPGGVSEEEGKGAQATPGSSHRS